MTARERILLIRLMGRITRYPGYAEALGIEVMNIQTKNQESPAKNEGSLPQI